jgi:signal transduction histidine kinase
MTVEADERLTVHQGQVAAGGEQMTSLPVQVLIIEDNHGDARLLQEMLKESSSLKYQVTRCSTLADALTHLTKTTVNIVLLDLGLPDAEGLDAVRRVHELADRIALIVLTGHDDETMATQALTEGAQDYLIKGKIGAHGLLRAIRYAIERQRMQVETDQARRLQLQRRDEFISTVSHELRTPLTSIRGALGLINAEALGKLPKKVKALVRIAYQNSERLVRIINDILDMEKINSGGLEMRIGAVAVTEFLQEALAVNHAYGVKYQVGFVLETTPTGAQVAADPDRLMQVMANLLSNAAKFSAPGSTVRVRASERDMLVRIEVEDHGTGIPEAFRERVFEKFAQADSSTSRRFEGTGLGLSITRRLVEAMEGTIGFTTMTDQGTTFYFELPRAVDTMQLRTVAVQSDTARYRTLVAAKDSAALAAQTGVARILHVEDDSDLSQVIEAALAGSATVVAARTLREAEILLREGSFSLLLLDLALPDGNGLDLLDRLPSLHAGPLPVVILSVSDVTYDVQERVAAALVKSRVSEENIVKTVLSFLPGTAMNGTFDNSAPIRRQPPPLPG